MVSSGFSCGIGRRTKSIPHPRAISTRCDFPWRLSALCNQRTSRQIQTGAHTHPTVPMGCSEAQEVEFLKTGVILRRAMQPGAAQRVLSRNEMTPKADLPIPLDFCAIVVASSLWKPHCAKCGLAGPLLWLLHLADGARLRKDWSQTPTADNGNYSSKKRAYI